MAKQNISIVVPAYQRVEQTLKTIEYLQNSRGFGDEFDLETIVSDSSPNDVLEVALRQRFGNVVIYVKPETPGIATGKNKGAQVATHNLLIFCDSDIEVEPDTIMNAISSLERPGVAAVTGSILWRGGEKDGQTDIPHDNDRIVEINGVSYLEAIYSRFMATYKNVFWQVGGYDSEVFNMRGEGSDLSIRYWRHGFPLAFDSSIVAHHVFDAPDSAALRTPNPPAGVAKDLLLLAYKYDLLDGVCDNFSHTLKTNFERYGEKGYYYLLQGIGQNLAAIHDAIGRIDQQKIGDKALYGFKFLEVFSDKELLDGCLKTAEQHLAPLK